MGTFTIGCTVGTGGEKSGHVHLSFSGFEDKSLAHGWMSQFKAYINNQNMYCIVNPIILEIGEGDDSERPSFSISMMPTLKFNFLKEEIEGLLKG